MKYRAIVGLGAALSLASAGSLATVFNLDADGSASGSAYSATKEGITLNISHTSRDISIDGDGLGVKGGILDSSTIDGGNLLDGLNELVNISFDQDVVLESITFSTFNVENEFSSFFDETDDQVTFSGIGAGPLSISGGLSGVATANINELLTGAFSVAAIGAGNDFRISSISVSAVPIPAAAWLFGSALMGIVGLRRKR